MGAARNLLESGGGQNGEVSPFSDQIPAVSVEVLSLENLSFVLRMREKLLPLVLAVLLAHSEPI